MIKLFALSLVSSLLVACSNSDASGTNSFIKLDSSGEVLSSSAKTWTCLKDKESGLIWENKTTDGGLHDMSWEYMNTSNTNGANPKDTNDSGKCLASNNKADGVFCDTKQYVAEVNTKSLCGYSNWRMPTKYELNETFSAGKDTSFFLPGTENLYYWSSTRNESAPSNAWFVNPGSKTTSHGERHYSKSIRLVHKG